MTTTPAPRPIERRARLRQRALLAGKLTTPDASTTIDCVIRNISEDGMMVELASPQLVPDELHLVHIKNGIAYDVEVIWRRGARLGLVLKDRHDLKGPVEGQLKLLRGIWTQMALR